ncbi:MAG TPA: DUF4236 domain-containing protein [Gemmatales bacterium]|nr:DUF4236 domain-containing protein [Gemmatales bacterium]HMP58209.1 DUF4236 domain-containing protein [Gemmatales bacterium]
MGFYIRKSIRVGPLRFNLSKSGIGVSVGIPGFRVGTGPRGNYVHMGLGGLYYRSTIPTEPNSTAEPGASDGFKRSENQPALKAIGSGDVSRMVDSSSAALMAEFDEKNRRIRTWPFALFFGLGITCVLAVAQVSPWLLAATVVILLLVLFIAYQYDVLAKTVVVFYELDATMEDSYERLHDCMQLLASCYGKWHIDAKGRVRDVKYHAGASEVVNRKEISITNAQPPYVKTNIEVPCLPLGPRTLYFFPERVLVFSSDGVGAVGYSDLSVSVKTSQFVESGAVPRDAEVVGHTWRFVNRDGGPDRRFKDNHQLAVCLYEELCLSSPTGLNEVIQFSRKGIGVRLNQARQGLAESVARAAGSSLETKPPVKGVQTTGVSAWNTPAKPLVTHSALQQGRDSSALFDTLLEILCCLMVADGRATSNEKKRIRELLASVKAPWSESDVDDRMAEFIERVQVDGYRSTVAAVLKEVERFNRVGKQDVLLHCLEVLASTNDKLGDRERQLCQRVKEIVSPG